MRESVRGFCLLLGFIWTGAESAAHGQSPITEEFRVNQETRLTQDEPRVAVGRNGEFAVSWRHGVGDTVPYTPLAAIRFYGSNGEPLGDETFLSDKPSGSPFLSTRAQGGFGVLWGSGTQTDARIILNRYDADGADEHRPTVIPRPDANMLVTSARLSRTGALVFSWLASYSDPRPSVFPTEVKVAFITPRGRYLRGGPISVGFDPEHFSYIGDLALDAFGNAVVVWAGECGPFGEEVCDVFAQRLSATGEKLGEPIRVNQTTEGNQSFAKVAVAPDGTFLVVWHAGDLREPNRSLDIYGQLFSPSGERIGSEFLVNTTVAGLQFDPAVAVDAFGNFGVVWASFRPENGIFGWDIRGRIFRYDGTPIATEFRLNSRQTANELPLPQLAFGGNGTFVAAWAADDGDFDGVFAQRFAASPADEACVASGRKLLCDTARTGSEPELTLQLPSGSSGTVLFGDLDGDGRADPCVRSGRQWLCDTEHRGYRWERLAAFGRRGGEETPLLGDVDGDGKAEACLFDAGVFSCDTAHDGGVAEMTTRFGQRGDRALLGDIDGDGRADPCVVRAGRFLCDTAHNGGEPEVSISFNPGRGTPLLGDFDGDGRADPCVHDGRRFSCDTAHDGGAAEAVLRFGHRGDRPLLGNLDGV